MKRTNVIRAALVAVAVVVAAAYVNFGVIAADDHAQDQPVSLMQQKLKHSQSLLEALVLENYDGIAREAKALHQISVQADWEGVPNRDYSQYGDQFRDAASKVERAAKESNLDAAAWQYMQLVVSCVECHKAVRGQAPAEVAMLQL